jgi:site-specific DNA recombinase
MQSTNGHGPKRAILYCRVSTDEQARSGYSLAQQLEALREYAAREGYEVLEEVSDPGQSGASLERPGLDRVRDLVAASSVSVVLAQDADRITRDPAHRAFLDEEFERFGTQLVALDDWGDNTHEGELLKYIKGWLSKGERLKTAERTRRGLLRKAREGKVIKGRKANFGFRFNETDDGLIIYEPEMKIVEKIFRMAASGMGPKAMQTRLYAEGVPSPTGNAMWPHRILKVQMVLNDLYKPHTYDEIAPLLSPEVAAKLDRDKLYGIWWYNRRNVTKSYDTEMDGDNGKRYVTRTSVRTRDEKDWIAVPVPACLPRKLVDQARLMIESRTGLERKHKARQWELKGVLRCSCGQNMITNTSRYKGRYKESAYHYYRCKKEAHYGRDACPQRTIRIERVEPLVRDFVFGVLSDPANIRRGLQALIERETEEARENPDFVAKTLRDKLSANARLRRAYQDQQAADLMSLEELAERLEELAEARKVLEGELATLERSQQRADELQRDRDAVLATLAASIPEALDNLTGEEINTVYRKLRLRVVPTDEGFDATGILCTLEPTPGGRRGRRAPRRRGLRQGCRTP